MYTSCAISQVPSIHGGGMVYGFQIRVDVSSSMLSTEISILLNKLSVIEFALSYLK